MDIIFATKSELTVFKFVFIKVYKGFINLILYKLYEISLQYVLSQQASTSSINVENVSLSFLGNLDDTTVNKTLVLHLYS